VASWQRVSDGEDDGGDGDDQRDESVHELLLPRQGCSDRLAGNL